METDSFQVSTIRFPYFFHDFGSLKLCQLPVGAGWKVEGGTPMVRNWCPASLDVDKSWVELTAIWWHVRRMIWAILHTDRGKTQAWANLMEIIFEHEITIRNNPSSNKWLVPTDGTWLFDIVSLSLQFLCFRFDRKIWWQLMTYIILHPFMKLSTGVILVRSTQGAKVTFIAISSFEWRPFV